MESQKNDTKPYRENGVKNIGRTEYIIWTEQSKTYWDKRVKHIEKKKERENHMERAE